MCGSRSSKAECMEVYGWMEGSRRVKREEIDDKNSFASIII
jgi:hypothetical protein